MSLLIPDSIVKATHLSEDELRVELAALMYQEDRLTLGRASEFAGISQEEFLKVLGARRIPIHYGLEDLESDIEAIRQRRSR